MTFLSLFKNIGNDDLLRNGRGQGHVTRISNFAPIIFEIVEAGHFKCRVHCYTGVMHVWYSTPKGDVFRVTWPL